MNSPTNSGPAAHAAGPAPYATLFVCTGNIARSASAELLARQRSPEDSRLVFASAGTAAVVGSPVAEEVGAELRERGVPFGEHRAQQLTGEMIRHADIVLAMEGHHRQWILDEWPAAVGKTFLLKHAARNLSAAHAPVSGMTDPAVWLRSHAAAAARGRHRRSLSQGKRSRPPGRHGDSGRDRRAAPRAPPLGGRHRTLIVTRAVAGRGLSG